MREFFYIMICINNSRIKQFIKKKKKIISLSELKLRNNCVPLTVFNKRRKN